MADTLAFVGLYNLVVGALYVYVGITLGRREVPAESRLAHRMFLMWWYALGATSIVGGLNIGLYRADVLHPVYYQVATQVSLLAIVLALLGLLYYMVYIYTGTARWFKPIVVFYALFYLALLGLVAANWNPPEGFTDNGWSIQVLPEQESTLSPAVGIVFVLLLIGPQLAAAVGFLMLGKRLEDPTQRYRVNLVGAAILVWFGTSIVASLVSWASGVELATLDAWQLVQRALGFAAVVTILAAYKPPKWVRERYGVQAV